MQTHSGHHGQRQRIISFQLSFGLRGTLLFFPGGKVFIRIADIVVDKSADDQKCRQQDHEADPRVTMEPLPGEDYLFPCGAACSAGVEQRCEYDRASSGYCPIDIVPQYRLYHVSNAIHVGGPERGRIGIKQEVVSPITESIADENECPDRNGNAVGSEFVVHGNMDSVAKQYDLRHLRQEGYEFGRGVLREVDIRVTF